MTETERKLLKLIKLLAERVTDLEKNVMLLAKTLK